MGYEVINLVMVTGEANHNKYYKMVENGDGTWTAEYGRVGASPQRKVYPMSVWDTKYREKRNKGYTDRTNLCQVPQEKPVDSMGRYKGIEDASVRGLVNYLMEKARTTIRNNYTVKSDQVTRAMINEAQRALVCLMSIKHVDEFNKELLRLYTIIPRRMNNVRETLASSPSDFARIVSREQDLLDVMGGQVVQQVAQNETMMDKTDKTILDALGLSVRDVTPNERASILKQLDGEASRYVKAWRVINKKTQRRYNEFLKKSGITRKKLLWHGSRTENWWSILQTGLVLRPTNAVITGKMFGYGLYYALSAKKSLGYTSLSGSYWANGSSRYGFMALMEVAYGNPLDVYCFDPRYYNLNAASLGKYDCLHAHKDKGMLRNDEIVIYREEQSTIKFLVELK